MHSKPHGGIHEGRPVSSAVVEQVRDANVGDSRPQWSVPNQEDVSLPRFYDRRKNVFMRRRLGGLEFGMDPEMRHKVQCWVRREQRDGGESSEGGRGRRYCETVRDI